MEPKEFFQKLINLFHKMDADFGCTYDGETEIGIQGVNHSIEIERFETYSILRVYLDGEEFEFRSTGD